MQTMLSLIYWPRVVIGAPPFQQFQNTKWIPVSAPGWHTYVHVAMFTYAKQCGKVQANRPHHGICPLTRKSSTLVVLHATVASFNSALSSSSRGEQTHCEICSFVVFFNTELFHWHLGMCWLLGGGRLCSAVKHATTCIM